MTTTPENQRRSPRIVNSGRLKGHLVEGVVPITIIELSRHGFSMHLDQECVVGTTHDVEFWSDSRAPVALAARVVHALRWREADDAVRYLAGLEFIGHDTPEVRHATGVLIESLGDAPPAA